MSRDPVVINVDLSGDKSVRDQIDTPENREAVAEVVRAAIGDEPMGSAGPVGGSSQKPPDGEPLSADRCQAKGRVRWEDRAPFDTAPGVVCALPSGHIGPHEDDIDGVLWEAVL